MEKQPINIRGLQIALQGYGATDVNILTPHDLLPVIQATYLPEHDGEETKGPNKSGAIYDGDQKDRAKAIRQVEDVLKRTINHGDRDILDHHAVAFLQHALGLANLDVTSITQQQPEPMRRKIYRSE